MSRLSHKAQGYKLGGEVQLRLQLAVNVYFCVKELN